MQQINWGEIKELLHNEIIDVTIEIKGIPNPYDVRIMAQLTLPSGNSRQIPMFYRGNHQFTVRFLAEEPGKWLCSILNHPQIEPLILIVKNSNKKGMAPLAISKDHHHFVDRFSGDHQFVMSYECNWLWALLQQEENESKFDQFIIRIKHFGFNKIATNIYAHDTEWCQGHTIKEDYGPPHLFCFGGTNEKPNFHILNENFFEKYDLMMNGLYNYHIWVELYFKVFNKMVNWPQPGSKDEENYFYYIIARYQAFPCVIWDFAKEAYYETNKLLIYNFYKLIDTYDSYQRLKTLHDDKLYYKNKNYRKSVDFITTQQHFDSYTTSYYYSEKYNMPISSAEFGYECGPAGMQDLSYMYGQSPEEFVQKAWEIIMAKSYPTYYYTYTAWDIIFPEHEPKGYYYWKILKDYIEEIKWEEFWPRPELCCWRGRCLQNKERDYIFFIDKNEHALFNIEVPYDNLEIVWLDIYTGKKEIQKTKIKTLNKPELIVLNNPFKNQWAIAHMKRRK